MTATPLSSCLSGTYNMSPETKNISSVGTSERINRTFFSSIHESRSGTTAQNFIVSKTSSYYNHAIQDEYEEFIDDVSSLPSVSKISQPYAQALRPKKANGMVCPCASFRGWKSISVKGKIASKSFDDLRGLGRCWEWEIAGDGAVKSSVHEPKPMVKTLRRYAAGESPLEILPIELLGSIIDLLAMDIPPNGFTARNIDLISLLRTSRGLHSATLATLYSRVTIPHSRIFRKFLSHITDHVSLGTIVRRLDFSQFNPTGDGMTARERAETLNLIPETLLQCLQLTPNLHEFLAQEHIDDDLDAKVIEKLLCHLPKLKALDFTACSSSLFRESFSNVIGAKPSPIPMILSITRLCLHECTGLPTATYSTLLPRLPHLTHLDVAHTRITDSALHSIPQTATLTHLNLSKCSHLSGNSVVNFLINHSAAQNLVYLNLAMDVKSHEMLTSDELTILLLHLPASLRSLNLKGSKMNSSHIQLLLPLTKHLEELGLGRHLSLQDLVQLLIPSESLSIEAQLSWVPHTLRYIDASDLSVAQLELGNMFSMSCQLLQTPTEPFEVLEINPDVQKYLTYAQAGLKRVGWSVREAGKRCWMVRERNGAVFDTGARGWKWGATYWGMRKVPVARAEVGGMYGYWMFKYAN